MAEEARMTVNVGLRRTHPLVQLDCLFTGDSPGAVVGQVMKGRDQVTQAGKGDSPQVKSYRSVSKIGDLWKGALGAIQEGAGLGQ